MWRDPHISPDRAGTEQSAQMEKTMMMMRLERLKQRANLRKIKLAPQNLNL
jgi:N-acetylglucosamine-6-phosphate deacetylase